jgi:hypothetical protein
VLLSSVLSGAFAEFERDIKYIDASASTVSDPDASGGAALIISECYALYSRLLVETRTQINKTWRQCLSLIAFALFLKAVYKITIQDRYFRNSYRQRFSHTLVISFLLGGRAPPCSVY